MSQTKVQIKRHLLKTISYRILSSLIGFLILYITTKNFKISISFSLSEFLFKPLVYFIHERVWYKWIKFGVIKEPEKKKKSTGLTEGKIKTQSSPPPVPQGKKVLNYSSNR